MFAGRRILFERCLIAAKLGGESVRAEQLPAQVVDAVAKCLAEADPQADVQLDISCPFCGWNWQASFDIVAFLWTEIEARACRLLQDVHVLARAYGWSEREVLDLSPLRRELYLEMVNA